MSCVGGAPQPETLRLVNFDDDAYEVGISVNKKMDTRFCRVAYSSLARPTAWYDVDMKALMASGSDGSSDTGVMSIAKEQEVRLDFIRLLD